MSGLLRALFHRGVGRAAPRWRRQIVSFAVVTLGVAGLAGCGQGAEGEPVDALAADAGQSVGAAAPLVATNTARPPAISLGAGFLAFPDEASRWVQTNPTDPRAAAISRRIASQPTALWLTGNESFGNLTEAAHSAKAANRTMLLTLYNIPLRWDGLSAPSTVTLAAYRQWIDRVATTIGTMRAVVVLEPDALWFYDRIPAAADQRTRLAALRYAVAALTRPGSRTRVYLDAGTASGSVTPQRMAILLAAAGVQDAAGYAVNTSSYAPAASILGYAQQIRASLQARGIADPRYVTDTGRNGASSWNNNWCNPSSQRLGMTPRLVRGANGLDMDLWIKAPGTSDGDCGPADAGAGTYGGEFIPSLAYSMLK